MFGFRLQAERPPEPRPVADGVVMRLDDVYEIDPGLMQIVGQQSMPVSDTLRIVDSRWEHLAWMHDHWADNVLSAEEERRNE
ncbi:MAG: hypothetical protein ACRDK3_09155 [Actinomycetota bacterium]